MNESTPASGVVPRTSISRLQSAVAPRTLRILLVESRPSELRSVLSALGEQGLSPSWECVESEAGFVRELDSAWDVILAGCDEAGFGVLKVLEVVQERRSDVPVVAVGGHVGEEMVARIMRKGASDFFLKSALGQLAASIRRVMDEREQRQGSRQAGEALDISVRQWQHLFDSMEDAVAFLDKNGRILKCNTAMAAFSGEASSSLVGRFCYEIIHRSHVRPQLCPFERMLHSQCREIQILSMGERRVQVVVDPVFDDVGNLMGALHMLRDVTATTRFLGRKT